MSTPTELPTELETLELAFEALEATRIECGAWSELEERAVAAIVSRLELIADQKTRGSVH